MLAWLACLVLWLGAGAAQAAPAAGTVISNQATGTFIDGSGVNRSNVSNIVQVTVAQVASFTLAANTVKSGGPGATVNFPHTLTNTGNKTDSFSLAVTGLPGGGFASLQIFADANGDGVPDNNIPIASTGPLPTGGIFNFVIAATVPGSATVGNSDQLRLDATSSFDPTRTTTGAAPSVAPLTDTVNVIDGPALTLQKSVSNTTPQPGDALAYRLTLRNTGGSAATNGQPVIINGAAATPVLIRDAIPPNTSFVSITTPVPAGTDFCRGAPQARVPGAAVARQPRGRCMSPTLPTASSARWRTAVAR